MLARNFLTPTELDISDKQFNALLQVLGMLERGELKMHHNWRKRKREPNTKYFDMGKWPERHCGSVGCIGFWAEKIGKVNMSCVPEKLDNLFYNYEATENETTTEQAAQALRNYLSTGKANWADVLA